MLCWKERIHDSPDADTSFFGAHLAWAVASLGLKYYLWKTPSINTGSLHGTP
jgi:hypothetical protein